MSRNPNYNEDLSNKLWIIVPAAGIGSRMDSEEPKQYLKLFGKTILEHTLERLLGLKDLAGIVVCISNNDQYWSKLPHSKNEKIVSVHGGRERMNSVYNALTYLQREQNLEDQFVLVHDAARPCVLLKDIERLISTLAPDEVGGILATPSVDTLKRVDENGSIVETIDRKFCWRAQTPQMFRMSVLQKSIELLLEKNLSVSDESAAIESAGYQAKVVEGGQENIKLTVPSDLALIESILASQKDMELNRASGKDSEVIA